MLNKKMLFLLFILAGFTTASWAGVDLSGLKDVSDAVDESAKDNVGVYGKMLLAFLPLLGFVVAPVITYFVKRKEAKQNGDDQFGVWMWVLAMAMVGFLGGTVFDYLIGMGLLNNAEGVADGGTEALKIAGNWWKDALMN